MSTAPTSATIPIEEFRTKLQEAVEARGASYQSIKVFIFRFEDDATGADEDAVTFSNCMKDVFGIDDIEDFAIEKTSKFAGFDVHERIIANLERLLHARSLLIITYIGHGVNDIESKRLQLISENGTVLDCCYAGSAVRAGANRSVQLLASCDERHTVRSRKDGVTFTQRFRNAAFALKNVGNLSVSIESLFGEPQ
ncbi:hypothetical protein V1506DRAFT_517682 [Lipomyces tetrasporus]